MTGQLQIGISRDDDQQIVQEALDAARDEHDAADAPRTSALTQICAAYIGYEGPLGEDAELNPERTVRMQTFRYRKKTVTLQDEDDATVDIPDDARGIRTELSHEGVQVEYLVPDYGGEA